MASLATSSAEELARLLNLFPLENLKATWPQFKAEKKDKICAEVAANHRASIPGFIDRAFSLCKQHIYLFERNEKTNKALPPTFEDGDRISHSAKAATYVLECVVSVVLVDPPEQTTISFPWPIRIDVVGQHVAVRFVVLAKDVPSYFPRRALTAGYSLTEDRVLAAVSELMSLTPLDVHKGMKHLWKTGFMDCYYTKYRKAKSGAIEIVDKNEKKGIRENDPDLFKLLMRSPMRDCQFVIEDDTAGVQKVGIDPGAGRLAFLQFADAAGAIDDVVRKILQNN